MPDIVQGHKEEIKVLISTYLNYGGLQVQVNVLTSELLRSAIDNPAEYEQLVVRIGGYSMRFNALDLKTKIEFVERFEAEESSSL